jgi:hypothetical protein
LPGFKPVSGFFVDASFWGVRFLMISIEERSARRLRRRCRIHR